MNGFFNDIALEDINYDGYPDIITDKKIWLNDHDSPGTFILQNYSMNVSNHDFEVIDINNDTLVDVYMGRFSGSDGDVVFIQDAPTYINQDTTMCFGSSIFLQGAWQTEIGTYLSYDGCNSLLRTTLSFYDEIDTGVTEEGGTLTANNSDATYQWLNCADNYSSIEDAVDQSYTPYLSGEYAVEITDNGMCADTSDCFYVIGTGIFQNSDADITIYPNPTQGLIHITIPSTQKALSIAIFDIQGKLVKQIPQKENFFSIDMTAHQSGVYLLKIQTETSILTQKIILNESLDKK